MGDPRTEKLAELVETEARIGDVLVESVDRSRANQRTIRLVAFSVVFDVLLSIGIGGMALDNRRIAHQEQSTRAAALTTCNSSNEARALERQLWGFMFDLPSTAAPTPAQQANLDRLRGFIATTFAARDCARLVK